MFNLLSNEQNTRQSLNNELS